MRPRNVLTETNDMRKLMGLPLLKEDSGQTINDVKKKVLNESTIEYENDQWLVIDKEEDKKEDKKEDKEKVNENMPAGFSLGMARQGGLTFTEETESEIFRDEGDGGESGDGTNGLGEPPLDQVTEQGALDANKEYEVKDKSGEVVGTYKSNRKPFAFKANPDTQYKDGDKIPEGLSIYEKHKFKDKEDPIEPGTRPVPRPLRIKETTGNSFAKYNITEGWFDNKKSYGDDLKKKDELEGYEPLTGLAELKDEARRIISFLTPGEGDEIAGKYMKEVYPAMALQVAQSLYSKIEKMM